MRQPAKTKRRKRAAEPVRLVTPADPVFDGVVPEKHIEGARYLVNLIARRKMAGKVDRHGRVLLNFDFLAKIMGTRATSLIIQASIDGHIITRGGQYVPGKQSFGYGLANRVGSSRFKFDDAGDGLAKKVVAGYGTRWKPPLTKTHRHLLKWVRRTRIHDIAGAHAAIDAQGYAAADVGLVRLMADSLHDGSVGKETSRPDAMGRFHTPIARANSELRPFLVVGDRPLVLIDVRNCQPLLAAVAVQLCQLDPSLLNPARFGDVFTLRTYLTPPADVVDAQALLQALHDPDLCNARGRREEVDTKEADAEEDRTPIMTSQTRGNDAQNDTDARVNAVSSAHDSGPSTTRAVPAGHPSTAAVTRRALHERYELTGKPSLKTGISDRGSSVGICQASSKRQISDGLATGARQCPDNGVTLPRGDLRANDGESRADAAARGIPPRSVCVAHDTRVPGTRSADAMRMPCGCRAHDVATANARRVYDEHPADLLRYIDLCQRGEFYESLMALPSVAARLPRDGQKARAALKRGVLVVFFDDDEGRRRWSPSLWAIDAAMQHQFPTIHAFLTMLRNGGTKSNPQHSHAAKTLQNIESSIIINGVCTTLMNERPDMPLLTIHDALIVPDVDAEYVQGVMRAEFAKWGLSPSMKAERLAPTETAAAA